MQVVQKRKQPKNASLFSLASKVTLPFAVAIVLIGGCKSNPNGPQISTNVHLSLSYATCTEVALNIGFADSPSGGDYSVERNGIIVLAGTFSGSEA
ncbi:MAG TPA: hypothetical protein VI758_11255, partial [Bacteroidota bacterium]